MAKKLPKTRYHLQKLTKRIERLESLKPFSGVSSGTGVRAAAYEAGNAARLRRQADELRRERALVRAGLLEIERCGSEALYRLTKDGLVQVLKDRIILEQNEILDGTVCYVVFDVPEDVKRTRNGFRDFLKNSGFTQLQQSIWSTTKDVAETMSGLIDVLGLAKWIRVLVGKEVTTTNPTVVG